MGSITTSKDIVLDLTVVSVTGEVTAKDIIDWIIDYYVKLPTKLILWDYTEADLTKGNMEDIENILGQVMKNSGIRLGGQTALVFGNKTDFRLGEIFSSCIESSKFDVSFRAFLDLDEAIQWLSD